MSPEVVTVAKSTGTVISREAAPRGLRRLAFGTIQNKIILPFLFLTVLVTMLGTYIVTRLVALNIQDRLTTQLLETSRAASDSIVAWERFQLDVLRLVVFSTGVPESLEAGDKQPLTDTLVALGSNQNVFLLLAINSQGEVIASAQRGNTGGYDTTAMIGQNLDDEPFVRSVLDAKIDQFGDKYAGLILVDGQDVLLTVAPVQNAQGRVVGAVAMGTPLRDVLDNAKRDTLADLTLFRPNGEPIRTTFVVVGNESTTALNITPAMYQETMTGSQGATHLQTVTFNGREFQTAYVPLVIRRDELGVLGVSWPSTLVTSVITTNRNGLAIMFSIVGMLVVLIGYVVAHNLTQPIRRLAEVAQSVAAGDLSQRSLVRTSDEIGVLGRVFDNMTLNLHEKTEALVQSYREQERKNAFLTAVIASAADGTVVVDPEGAIMHQNPAAQEIITHDNMLWNYTLRELARETKDAGHALLRLEVDKLWYEAKAAPVVTTDHEEIGVVMTLRDITEEILTDRMRTAFILQMSHELYTPLVTARGYTELAKSTIGNKVPLAHEMLDQSLSSLRELRGMISQILDISRMIRGGFELTTEKLDLAELLYSVIDEYKELAESKNLRLQIDIGPIQSYSGGREPLRWTFRHLIKNAYDYTLPGGLIRITALDEDGCFVLKVRDTGVGIAPHEKPHIFEQFYRGQPVSRDGVVIDTRGAGLGLFVVDQVVRVHEGEVKVWTEQGIGSEFQIRLPR